MVKNREHQGSVSHRSTVWILEDDADISYVLDYFLTEQGFQIRLFSSAESFRDSLASGLPDLFLMDVMLPDGDGVELCRELKQNPRCSSLPVLMMSAHAGLSNVKECEPEGFIPKPFNLDHVLQCIQELLN